MATTIQLRRGKAEVWAKNNPTLARGEPGFVIDENRLKIGDGETAWNDLDYIGEGSVYNAETHFEFPSIGKVNVLYKASQEKIIYQWNNEKLVYEQLSSTEEKLNIDLIHGGVANGGITT